MRQRFFREARVVAQLTDPAVVTLYDYGEEAEQGLYMVFELVRGRTVHQVIRSGPQDAYWVAHIMLQLLSALEEAHGMGAVHRDIKPGNVMLVEDTQGRQRARLLDFGIAKVIANEDGESSHETKEGLVLGTPRYMSPEQARGKGNVDARSDLYSLAVLGYALISGKNPFERPSVIETIMAHVQTPPPPLDTSLDVPSGFEAVLQKALEKDPAHRFQSAVEMSAAIHAVFDAAAMAEARATSAASSSVRGQSLGSSISGLATPTPPPAVTSTPRPFAGPDVVDPTHGAPVSAPGTHSEVLPRPDRPRMPMILAAFCLGLGLVVGVLWLQQRSKPQAVAIKVVRPGGERPGPDALPGPRMSGRSPSPNEETWMRRRRTWPRRSPSVEMMNGAPCIDARLTTTA